MTHNVLLNTIIAFSGLTL